MNIGIVINTRYYSSRAPGKCLMNLNGKTLLEHLVDRVAKTGLKTVIAYPSCESQYFAKYRQSLLANKNVYFYETANVLEDKDPLRRMYNVARNYGFNAVVRICTDKIFVDPIDIEQAVNAFQKKGLDYVYSSSITPGCGFEVISFSALKEAASKFENIEHISYAIRSVTQNYFNIDYSHKHNPQYRFLIDYPEDVTAINTILACCGNDVSVSDVIAFCDNNPWILRLNKLPEVTVYTCFKNSERFLQECIQSVLGQSGFKDWEYLLVDDHSDDRSSYFAAKYAALNKNIRYYRNELNLGLASSSNRALSYARGRHIIRLDSDDYFSSDTSVMELLCELKERDLDGIYPNNYFGALDKVQEGKTHHHAGGALFKTFALNFVRFTDGLRGYEGHDLYLRAKDILKIGYLNKPLFFYRQHEDSLTKGNVTDRALKKLEVETLNEVNP